MKKRNNKNEQINYETSCNRIATTQNSRRKKRKNASGNCAGNRHKQGIVIAILKRRLRPEINGTYKLALALDVSDMWLEGYDVPMERSQKQKEIDFKNNLYKKIAQDMELLKTISQYYNLPEEKQKTIRDLVDQMSR